MKDLERYLGETYINICQPAIITKTLATFSDPDMSTIIPETGTKRPKMDTETTYLKKKSIDKAIYQKLRKKDV